MRHCEKCGHDISDMGPWAHLCRRCLSIHSGMKRPRYPERFDALDVATWRPTGTLDAVWARIHQEVALCSN